MNQKQKQTKSSASYLKASKEIKQILNDAKVPEIRSLFAFDSKNTDDEIIFKFNLWIGFLLPGYKMDETKTKAIADAPYHDEIDRNNLAVYRGKQTEFIDIAYRGGAKTTRTKLFMAYVISNDMDHFRRYIRILAEDISNSTQIVTDIYNIFVDRKVRFYYPEIFTKTEQKRVEKKDEFDTATGVKVKAKQVGVEQRGALQDEYRPDFIWFDDFESRKTVRSALILQKIWDNMEEARTGLSRNGGCLYTCNYFSERGNVHKLITRSPEHTLIIPIHGRVELTVSGGVLSAQHFEGAPTWPAQYTKKEVELLLNKADDPAGEYLCAPSAGDDIFFPRAILDKMEKKKPIENIGAFKIFHEYDPSHRYGDGADISDGVGLDSSASVVIDFTQIPARVVSTYKSNTIKPTPFAHEIKSHGNFFGRCIIAPENNNRCGGIVIAVLKSIYDNIFIMPDKAKRAGKSTTVKELGWNTNTATRPSMMHDLRKAVFDGHLELSDPDLIAEARAYTSDDLLDKEVDPRLSTRHFDLLTAAAIAWQTRNVAEASDSGDEYEQEPYHSSSEYENGGIAEDSTFTPRPIAPQEIEDHNDDYEQPPYEAQSDFENI